MNTIEEITKLKTLLDQGAISQEEFNQLKKNVFDKAEETKIEPDNPTNTNKDAKNGKSNAITAKLETSNSTQQKPSFSGLTQENINELVANSDELNSRGYGSRDLFHYTGSWEIIKEIPQEVKDAVKKYGVSNNNYSIIKYSSSKGVSGYCLYYKSSYGDYISLEPLYMGQVSLNSLENDYGALGICGGELKN